VSSPGVPLAAPEARARRLARRHDDLLLAAQLGATLVLGLGLAAVAHRHGGGAFSAPGLAAWLGGITVAYGLDRLAPARRARDRAGNPRRTAALHRRSGVARGVVLAGGAALGAGLAAEPTALLVPVAALTVAALAYPWLARIPLAKNAVVAACFALGAATVPTGGAPPTAGIIAAMALLVFADTVLCDLKDRAADRALGVRGLGSLVGDRAACAAAAAIALAGGLVGILAGAPELGLGAALLLGLSAHPATCAHELTGPPLVDVAVGGAALLALVGG
jgi:4-hydroxybenzoate polyprenyltransferase